MIEKVLKKAGPEVEILTMNNVREEITVAPVEELENIEAADVNVPYTTRQPRNDEIPGVHYHFVSTEVFRGLIAMGEMKEWGEGNNNVLYGLRKGASDDQSLARRTSCANPASSSTVQSYKLKNEGGGFGVKLASALDKYIVGVYIVDIEPHSPADKAGIPTGMQVTSVNNVDSTRSSHTEVEGLMKTCDMVELGLKSNIPGYLAMVQVHSDLSFEHLNNHLARSLKRSKDLAVLKMQYGMSSLSGHLMAVSVSKSFPSPISGVLE